ncbi:MAG: iron-sulfur cluster assembly protein, partial [Planctomycetota bacterium]
MPLHEDTVREQLKKVIDPELFVNIVDLGLVYV